MKIIAVKSRTGSYYHHVHAPPVLVATGLLPVGWDLPIVHSMPWYKRADGAYEAICERDDVKFIAEM